MNLEAERARFAQSRRATEPLKRNERARVEGKMNRAPRPEGVERVVHRTFDHASRVTIERIRCAVRRLHGAREAIEKRHSARADNEPADRAR